jgi:hypothetical protein
VNNNRICKRRSKKKAGFRDYLNELFKNNRIRENDR